MDILNIINAVIVGIGIPTIIGAAIYLGRKLQILDDLKDVRDKFSVVESRVNDMWADRLAPSHSPRQLNTKGQDILDNSGIKEIVDGKRNYLLELVKKENAKNAYDAEAVILSIMTELPKHCPDIIDQLKEGAFKAGVDISALLFVGGIYFRNLIFKDLGFSLEDLDKPKKP